MHHLEAIQVILQIRPLRSLHSFRFSSASSRRRNPADYSPRSGIASMDRTLRTPILITKAVKAVETAGDIGTCCWIKPLLSPSERENARLLASVCGVDKSYFVEQPALKMMSKKVEGKLMLNARTLIRTVPVKAMSWVMKPRSVSISSRIHKERGQGMNSVKNRQCVLRHCRSKI